MRMYLTTEGAVLAAGVMIAVAILVAGRWEIASSNTEVYRLDRWTGAVVACGSDPADRAETVMGGHSASFQCSR